MKIYFKGQKCQLFFGGESRDIHMVFNPIPTPTPIPTSGLMSFDGYMLMSSDGLTLISKGDEQ